MIGEKPTQLCFTPVCCEDIGEPGPAGEEETFARVRQLRQLITVNLDIKRAWHRFGEKLICPLPE